MKSVKCADFYDKIYKTKSWRYFKRYHELYDRAASFITNEDVVLELGCGMGSFAGGYCSKRCKDFMAIDFSKYGIYMARKRWPMLADKFTVLDFKDLEHLKFDYNVVCSLEVLEHIDTDVDLLYRLKKGVLVLLSVPKNEKIINGRPKGWPVHRRSYSKETILDRYGEIINIRKIIPIVSWFLIVGKVRL